MNELQIPYGTTKPEVVAALGRNARIAQQPAGTPYLAIHIIMERSTAKSMDCYVEFESAHEAQYAVGRFENQLKNGHHPRIGDRKVRMELCSQEELMRELFPKAKCVQWHGQIPTVHPPIDKLSVGFQGFITGEELVMTAKFAEFPQRVRRPLSLVFKQSLPWHAVPFRTTSRTARVRVHHQLACKGWCSCSVSD